MADPLQAPHDPNFTKVTTPDDPEVPEAKRKGIANSALWGTIACGAGLFSDGYLNAIMGPVGSILVAIYGSDVKKNGAYGNLRSISFIGTVVGQLFFGYTSDHVSRKWSLLVSTIILIIFAILSAGAYGGGSLDGMLNALIAYRFFTGIGIGGEYPAGSVGAAEHSGNLRKGTRNRWFILFTNVQIDLGFVIAYLVAMIVVRAGEAHLRAAWRICLALGAIPPLSLLYLRIKIKEPETYTHEKMSARNTPWWLVIRFYWFRLMTVSLIWFIYDFCSYSFSNFSDDIIANFFVATGQPNILWKNIGWGCFMNFWYMPGCILGSFLADVPWIGPKLQLIGALVLQGIIGIGIAGGARTLDKPSALGGFVILNGIFLALGEVGPGDLIGLFASKTSATAIRGKYYGLAAAFGKIGAYVGGWVFTAITNKYAKDPVKANAVCFYVGASLCFFSAAIALLLPSISQDVIAEEDIRFREFLVANGYDTSLMGVKPAGISDESIVHDPKKGSESPTSVPREKTTL